MKNIIIILFLFIITSCTVTAEISIKNPQTFIIESANEPIKLKDCQSKYKSNVPCIEHKAKIDYLFKDSVIAAVELGFIKFDIFGEYLGIYKASSFTDYYNQDKWVELINEYSFHHNYVFIHKIRYKDGRLWKVDLNAIRDNLSKFEKDLSTEKLNNILIELTK